MKQKHYIDADLAIRHIEELTEDARKRDIEPEFSAMWVIEFLNNFPQAADAPKQAKWVKISKQDGVFACKRCIFITDHATPYCPNCGAYMGEDAP